MGGAICAHLCFEIQSRDHGLFLAGCILIDIVEGSALLSDTHMREVIKNRKKEFKEESDAIRYTIGSGYLHNVHSARISVPSQLKPLENGSLVWRTDLEKTQEYWNDWYSGLSNKFLSIKGPKLLVVANMNRLDNTMTVAQMQGKYVLKLIDHVGHFIHEDQPEKTATAILDFINKFETFNLQKKNQ